MEKIIEARLYKSDFLEAHSRIEFDIIFKEGKKIKEAAHYTVHAYGNISYDITNDEDFKSQAARLVARKLRKITGKRLDDKAILAFVDYSGFEETEVVNLKYWNNALEELQKANVVLDTIIIEDEMNYESEEEAGIIPNYFPNQKNYK